MLRSSTHASSGVRSPRMRRASRILAAVGITPGKDFDPSVADPKILNRVPKITFDRALNTFTTSSAQFHAFGKQSGPIAGTLTFSNANRTLTLTPTRPFYAGESVMVLISHNLRAADGSFLRAQGYSFTFTVGVTPTYHRFELFDSFSNRDTPEDITRIYGGLACDLNRDGRLDLSTINQDSGDLRTFLHTGSYDTPYAAPVTPSYVARDWIERARAAEDPVERAHCLRLAEQLIVHVDGMFGRNKIECTQEDCVDRLLARHGFIVDCVDLAGGCGCAATATGYRRAG